MALPRLPAANRHDPGREEVRSVGLPPLCARSSNSWKFVRFRPFNMLAVPEALHVRERMPKLTVKQLRLSDVFQDMARLELRHRPGSKAGRVIVLAAQGRRARALARGAPGRDPDSIYLDDATRYRLGLSSGEQVEFEITPGGFWDELMWGWQSTNAVTRIGTRLAVLSVALGVLGLILGIVALLVTFVHG